MASAVHSGRWTDRGERGRRDPGGLARGRGRGKRRRAIARAQRPQAGHRVCAGGETRAAVQCFPRQLLRSNLFRDRCLIRSREDSGHLALAVEQAPTLVRCCRAIRLAAERQKATNPRRECGPEVIASACGGKGPMPNKEGNAGRSTPDRRLSLSSGRGSSPAIGRHTRWRGPRPSDP